MEKTLLVRHARVVVTMDDTRSEIADGGIFVRGNHIEQVDATSELQQWLIADYGFSERGAGTFMGQAAEYEVANVVDPNFTVVAKIRKALLPRR